MPARRPRASWMSASVGAISVVIDLEHLLEYLPYRSEGVELAALHLVEQAPELRVVGDRLLQVRLRPRGGDGEDLSGEILAPPGVEEAFCLEVRTMLGDPVPELLDSLALKRLRQHDRRPPLALLVEREDRTDLADHRLRRGMIPLVHCDHVGDLHDSGL